MRKEPLSMLAQSNLIDGLIQRCVMRDGEVAGDTVLVINREAVDDLVHLAGRLRRMSHYQDAIEKLVMGRR